MIARKDLKQIGSYLYEVDKGYRKDMRVPARIYADETILQAALQDSSIEQLINTSTLPGIVQYALAMPDIHQGYGFSIGGVVATSASDGVISPGGVGYDINCLAGDTRILHEHGYTRPIASMVASWPQASLTCFRLGDDPTVQAAAPRRWLAQKPRKQVYRLTTASGKEVVATADHPFLTTQGMLRLEHLRVGEQLAVYPFEGIPHESPSDDVILDEDKFLAFIDGLGKGEAGQAATQILAYLKERDLMPLRYSSPATPYLCKLLGFVFGDGSIHFESHSGKGIVAFYGKPDDLADIRADLLRLGVTPSRVYRRQRHHAIRTTYAAYAFERIETWCKVVSTAFACLLACLGAPVGNKAMQAYSTPAWLHVAPIWQKRLFLAAYFGAEMTAPQTVKGHGANFTAPVVSLNKRQGYEASGGAFLAQLSEWLAEFGVETQALTSRPEQINADGSQSYRWRLILSADPDNLRLLWQKVGYAYHRERKYLAAVAIHYLTLKKQHIAGRTAVAAKAVALAAAGHRPAAILAQTEGAHANRRFIVRSLYEGRRTSPRIAADFPDFDDFRKHATTGLGRSGMVWDCIASITPVEDVAFVYDFTVDHPDHNFVAAGFVVSNCGVRLLASGMEEGEVRPHLQDLATAVYHKIPSGVGVEGFIRLSDQDMERVLETGATWTLTHGMARREDLVHTEEEGSMPGAQAAKISREAKKRGRNQLGTLGAGNHFAEIDVIDEIFDEEIARAFGLFEGQVVLQIHCGSRGLGHQVCTDYVSVFQGVIKKYGITLPDRQLVCAPLTSPEGQDYLAAMAAAANFAWANRQALAYQARQAFEAVLAGKVRGYDLRMVYDIAHNMAKLETHEVEGRSQLLCVHRKGATRAFGPGSHVLPPDYVQAGQPVFVPGSMGTASYVLAGTEGSMRQTFGSTCHGAGRQMSRSAARKLVRGDELKSDLERDGIAVRAGSLSGLAEEAPIAYKDVSRVVEVVHNAGIARKVAKLRPIAVVKG